MDEIFLLLQDTQDTKNIISKKIATYRFSIRTNPFGKVCLFDFYDIVIQKRNSLLKSNRNYMEGVKP